MADMAGARKPYQDAEEKEAEGESEDIFWARAVSIDQAGLGVPFSATTAAEIQNDRYVFLREFGAFAEAPGEVFQSLYPVDTLLGGSSRDILRFILSTIEGGVR